MTLVWQRSGPSHYWSDSGSPHSGTTSGPEAGTAPHHGPAVDGTATGHGEPRPDATPAELSAEKRDEILAMQKGTRPDPNFEKYGIAQRDGTSFVMPKNEADALMDATRGDPRALESSLCLPEGFLDSKKLVRIDIDRPEDFGLRLPSGNEAGANEQWIPGGFLTDGAAEAVVDGGKIPRSDYSVSEVRK